MFSKPGSINPGGDNDWIKFTLTQPSNIDLQTSGSSGDTIMYLFVGNCTNQIDYDDDDGIGYFSY